MSNLENVTAVILAGGLGTRLRSVVADRPKVLAEVVGRPFLTYLLNQLDTVGVRKLVLCTGYLGEQIEETFGTAYRGLQISYSQEPVPLGTGGALRAALPLIKWSTVLVMNGDSYCDADIKALYRAHRQAEASATMLLTSVDDVSRYGSVRVEDSGVVTCFEEKQSSSGAGWINAGIYVLDRTLISEIPPGGEVSLERDIFPQWASKRLYSVRDAGRFLDIGTASSYAEAQEFFA